MPALIVPDSLVSPWGENRTSPRVHDSERDYCTQQNGFETPIFQGAIVTMFHRRFHIRRAKRAFLKAREDRARSISCQMAIQKFL